MVISKVQPSANPSLCDIDTKLHPRDAARLRQLCDDIAIHPERVRLNVGQFELHVASGALALPTRYLLERPPHLVPSEVSCYDATVGKWERRTDVADLCPDTDAARAQADAGICHELAHIKWHDEAAKNCIGWTGIVCSLGVAFALPQSTLLRPVSLRFWPVQAACVGLGVVSLYAWKAVGLAYMRFCERRADREAATRHRAGLLAGLLTQLQAQIAAGQRSAFVAAQLDADGNIKADRWHPRLTERIRALSY